MEIETTSPETWLSRAAPELEAGRAAWRTGNAGRGRVCSRRAAGMALQAWLCRAPRPGYGRSFMNHLNALADDRHVETAIREAAARLCARPVPAGGFEAPVEDRLTPVMDAERILTWVAERVGAAPE